MILYSSKNQCLARPIFQIEDKLLNASGLQPIRIPEIPYFFIGNWIYIDPHEFPKNRIFNIRLETYVVRFAGLLTRL